MRRFLTPALCGASAAAGGLLALLLVNHDPTPRLAAQERPLAQVAPARRQPGSAPRIRLPSPVATGRTPEELVNIRVYERVNRSVVNINTRSVRTDSFFMLEVPSEGSGSGSVLDRRGHILTNYHVVDGAQQIEVTLAGGQTYQAALVGHDTTNDVAVLRIDAPPEELLPVELGDSSNLQVGQKVFAIGNPFGLERTLTVGIVSSLNRTLPSRRQRRMMKSIIQVDAAMNPGNSGGPLLDTAGQVIGMNTAIASRTGQNTGVGFAIPVSRIKRIVPVLIEKGRVTRPEIGITRVMVTERGLLIATVAPDGPAARAGLQGFRIVRRTHRQGVFTYETQAIDRSAADLIVAVDGRKVTSVDQFMSYVEEKQPGDEVVLQIVRNGQTRQVAVRLGAGES